jgi:hypothetical protein
VICPWCLHYGSEDEEYMFDEELYCGICAQQIPQTPGAWTEAFRAMDAEMISYIEQELNKIAVSRSGLRPDLLKTMGEAIDGLAALRESGNERRLVLPEEEYARWVEFACTYYEPRLR